MNEIVAASKSHHMRYANMKRTYTQLVALHARNLPKVERANFIITWYCKNKRKDPDNVASGAKFVLDGLVDAGMIPNDGWNEIGDITHRFKVDKENPRVEIRIEEIKNEVS